ncbi:hypothetical protein [Rufibacter sp. LB8]|uniref:hypothetical protein n=1 Tax=Rufibacter sp. LB8 TaxID=2777781 RepID=UPI00178C210A|nr:hypothetical protein [Rufibacter sp. LB8]
MRREERIKQQKRKDIVVMKMIYNHKSFINSIKESLEMAVHLEEYLKAGNYLKTIKIYEAKLKILKTYKKGDLKFELKDLF